MEIPQGACSLTLPRRGHFGGCGSWTETSNNALQLTGRCWNGAPQLNVGRSRTMNDAVQARGQAEGTRSLSIGRRAIVAAGLGLAVSALLVDCREPRRTEALKMGRNADAFDFLLGEWEIAMLTMPEGSTVGRRAILNVHRILD